MRSFCVIWDNTSAANRDFDEVLSHFVFVFRALSCLPVDPQPGIHRSGVVAHVFPLVDDTALTNALCKGDFGRDPVDVLI